VSTSNENFFKYSKMSIFEDCVRITVYPPEPRVLRHYMMNNHQLKPLFVTLCI